jgi:hypothetical protein
MLTKLKALADDLDAQGDLVLANQVDEIMKEAQGFGTLVPRDLKADPMAGYTDPSKVKVHTHRPEDTPIVGDPKLKGPAPIKDPRQLPPTKKKPAPLPRKADMVSELLAIAGDLDDAGHYEFASELDAIVTEAAKKDWMSKAVNPKEKGELRKKMKAKEGDKIPTAKLEAEKKKLQEKGKGDKKMSKKDREKLSQIIFALNARKSKNSNFKVGPALKQGQDMAVLQKELQDVQRFSQAWMTVQDPEQKRQLYQLIPGYLDKIERLIQASIDPNLQDYLQDLKEGLSVLR